MRYTESLDPNRYQYRCMSNNAMRYAREKEEIDLDMYSIAERGGKEVHLERRHEHRSSDRRVH